ncbi:hypothetical protein EDB85DRAFT_244863 [Lactarius pseudohatsudake]|nr:hypothetical protein EDB85DRAFT_244863 [Lactarius pseudohatsudake]
MQLEMQLDGKDAEECLAKDRESTPRDQVAALEACGAAARFKKTAVAAVSVLLPPRPDSRNNTVYPSPSVFASSRYDWSAAVRCAASPTPSIVSVARTLGDDGWHA